MIKNYLIILFLLLGISVNAQTVISSTSFANNNGSGTVTFNLENTNAYDIIITDIAGVTGTSSTASCEVWYKTTPLNGSPGAISTANGWVLGASGSFTGIANSSTSTTQPFLSNISVTIPGNTTYAMAIFATSQRYSTISSGTTTFSAGGVNFITGTNIGYGGGTPPATPGNSPRGWIGEITFIPACFGPTGLAASNVTTTDADLSWNAVPNSYGYEYVVDQNPGNPTGAGTATTATSHHVSGLNINTTYYLHLRNKCLSAFSNWVNFPFTTADAYCKPPNTILFYNIAATSAGVLWSQMPTADHYQYFYDISLTTPGTGQNIQNTTNISTTLTGLSPDTKYYFFVRSVCLGGNDSSFWRVDSFVTKTACLKPEVVTSAYGMINQVVSWNAIKTAIAYEYVVNSMQQDPAFGTEVYDTTLSVALPADNSNQYLHIRTKCNSQFTFSDWVLLQLRETPASVGDVVADNTIGIYPNPAHDVLFVKNAQDKTYQILDVRGSIIATGLLNGEEVAIPVDQLATGVYILQVDTESGKQYNRFVKY